MIQYFRMSDSEGENPNPKEEQSPDAEWTLESFGVRSDDYDVNLEHRRIGEIRDLEVLENVECLCLRNDMIRQVQNLLTLTTLTELDLYDNLIKKVEHIETLVNLEILDFRGCF